MPCVYGKIPRIEDNDGPLYIVDVSFPPDVLAEWAMDRPVHVLDHHKTAAEDLAAPIEGVEVVFDMERSGAQIAWDFFHDGVPRPLLVDYVGDRDLWRKELPGTDAVAEVVFSTTQTLEAWDELARTPIEKLIELGERRLETVGEYIREVCRYASRHRLDGLSCRVVYAQYWHISDLLHVLDAGVDFSVGWRVSDEGDRALLSFRSRLGGADVSEVARSMGGGGHEHAAGASVPLGWWLAWLSSSRAQ